MGDLEKEARIVKNRYMILEDTSDSIPIAIHYSICSEISKRRPQAIQSIMCSCTLEETIKYAIQIIAERNYTKDWIMAKCCFP